MKKGQEPRGGLATLPSQLTKMTYQSSECCGEATPRARGIRQVPTESREAQIKNASQTGRNHNDR